MTELNIVPKGAVLIRNGLIEDVGPARRVENLAGARQAREIDATGRVIMPAFVDADVALVESGEMERQGDVDEAGSASFRLMSRKRGLASAAAVASECAKYGSLAIGANTRCAGELKTTLKLLRIHRAVQLKPVRIRSIFSPHFSAGGARTSSQALDALTGKWLPSIKSKNLAGVVEFTVGESLPVPDISTLRAAALIAAGLGFAIRFRSARRLEPVHLQLALSAGAVGIIAPMDTLRAFVGPLSLAGCVRLIPASEGLDNPPGARLDIRRAIDEGAAIAITSSYREGRVSSLNMQYLVYLAVHKLGLSPEEAITATIWNPACSLRLSHVTGSLQPGKSADLLLMDVPDYRELSRRAGHNDAILVMRTGRIITRSAALNAA
jgi:imidazolonepropionase